MLAKKVRLHDLPDEEQVLTPTYGQRLLRKSLPRYDLPEDIDPLVPGQLRQTRWQG